MSKKLNPRRSKLKVDHRVYNGELNRTLGRNSLFTTFYFSVQGGQ